jgi:hypothetical protein
VGSGMSRFFPSYRSPPGSGETVSSDSSEIGKMERLSTIIDGIGLLVFTPKLRMRSPTENALPFPVESRFTASL